jgi:dihydrolipoamide dehydrogenase
MDTYDLTVIGSGPGGYVAAIRGAQLGFRTALIEKDSYLGGTCLNVGCIPSKAMLHSTEQYQFMKQQAGAHGIESEGLRMNLLTLQERRKSVVETMRSGVDQLVSGNKVEVITGHATLMSTNQIRVFRKDSPLDIESRHIIIATGSQPASLPMLPFDGERVLSSTEALTLKDLPESMIVVGGGAIGLELGSVWSRLGTKVTIVEFLPEIAAGFDPDISKTALRVFKKQGMEILTSTRVIDGTVNPNGVTIKAEKDGVEMMLEAEKVLVAVGRKPFTESLGLEAAGVEVDEKGRVITNAHLQTSVPGIFAIGDVTDGPMLAHKAEEEGVAVVEYLADGYGHVNYDLVPNVIYTDPEIAGVGLTESQAKERYESVSIGKFNFAANGRAVASDHAHGLVKIIADTKTDRVVGAHIIGSKGSELIASIVAHMEYGGSSEDIARTMHAHPTMSEAIKEAALSVEQRAIHAINR